MTVETITNMTGRALSPATRPRSRKLTLGEPLGQPPRSCAYSREPAQSTTPGGRHRSMKLSMLSSGCHYRLWGTQFLSEVLVSANTVWSRSDEQSQADR